VPLQLKKIKILKQAVRRHWAYHQREADRQGRPAEYTEPRSLAVYYWLIPLGGAALAGALLGALVATAGLAPMLMKVFSSRWLWTVLLVACWAGIGLGMIVQARSAREMAAAALLPGEEELLQPVLAGLGHYRFVATILAHALLSPLLILLLRPSSWGAAYFYALSYLLVYVWAFGAILVFTRKSLPLYDGSPRIVELARALYVPTVQDVLSGIYTIRAREIWLRVPRENRNKCSRNAARDPHDDRVGALHVGQLRADVVARAAGVRCPGAETQAGNCNCSGFAGDASADVAETLPGRSLIAPARKQGMQKVVTVQNYK
jgi:hypothetical protein